MPNDLDQPTYYSSSYSSDNRSARDVERERVYIPRYAKVVTVIEGRTACPNAGPAMDHAHLKSDPALWAELECIGTMPTYDDEPGSPQVLELRNCNLCFTSLAKAVQS